MKLGRNVARTFLDYYKLNNLIDESKLTGHINSFKAEDAWAVVIATKFKDMGGLTPSKKPSASQMGQKALKCTIELYIQSITCPGVVLPSQEDIYVSVRIMGQYQKSKCVPPVFPLLLHEKIVFVKTFVGAVDPAAVAEHLENDTTSLELIQLIPPEGEILATFEEDTREFLYPGSCLTPRSPGPEREILMKRSISFPGISPKVEFSTTSIIEECDVKHGQPATSVSLSAFVIAIILQLSCGRSSAKPCSVRTCPADSKKKKPDTAPSCGYEKPTVSSQSRAPSPYTHRKMCQLSEEARQRLSNLKLGPYTFKKETVPQAPFVVPEFIQSVTVGGDPQTSAENPKHPRTPLQAFFCALYSSHPLCQDVPPLSSRKLISGDPSVRLDNGTFWTNRAAAYTGKPHRAVFEDSLSKIYKKLYRKASHPGHNGQST
ncbi:hypothetical protein cypCar_00032566 [Cyprinus carpio]|nr:hypothetical protein cypCar_00032566 [Cyprinus carpio]